MGGKVAKKLGDGLMALFGYPVAQPHHSTTAATWRPGRAFQETAAAAARVRELRCLGGLARRRLVRGEPLLAFAAARYRHVRLSAVRLADDINVKVTDSASLDELIAKLKGSEFSIA
jgi:class 3 adenylate cyclase